MWSRDEWREQEVWLALAEEVLLDTGLCEQTELNWRANNINYD